MTLARHHDHAGHDHVAREFFAAVGIVPTLATGRPGGDGCLNVCGEFATDDDARRFVALCIGKRNVVGLTYYSRDDVDGIGPTVTLSVRVKS